MVLESMIFEFLETIEGDSLVINFWHDRSSTASEISYGSKTGKNYKEPPNFQSDIDEYTKLKILSKIHDTSDNKMITGSIKFTINPRSLKFEEN
jgi:hypothetical protein